MHGSIYMYKPNTNNYPINNDVQLVDLSTGFVRGNMFQDSYDPWNGGTNYLPNPTTEREVLLRRIREIQFAMVDLNLFLDTHQSNRQMLETYNALRVELDRLIPIYEEKYGPLTLKSPALQNYPWAWVMGPWPWEKEAN